MTFLSLFHSLLNDMYVIVSVCICVRVYSLYNTYVGINSFTKQSFMSDMTLSDIFYSTTLHPILFYFLKNVGLNPLN